jgi:hypothetical protein
VALVIRSSSGGARKGGFERLGGAGEVRPLDPPMALELVTVESAAAALPPAAEAFCEVLRQCSMALLEADHRGG